MHSKKPAEYEVCSADTPSIIFSNHHSKVDPILRQDSNLKISSVNRSTMHKWFFKIFRVSKVYTLHA